MIIKGHGGNILHGKHEGILGKEIENNKGVFRGSPISALLYIIFADGIMDEYKNEINTQNPQNKNDHEKSKYRFLMGKTPIQTNKQQ